MPPQRIQPKPGHESVWDYPRPPRVELTAHHIRVVFNGVMIADTRRAYRVLETSHPPVYYLPPADEQMQYFSRTSRSSVCEWKGRASYYSVRIGDRTEANAAWFYPDPVPEYEVIKDHLVFYPQLMDVCYVDGERVTPQPAGFYGGWITRNVVGPFKGEPGTQFW
ncbi:MAG: DUF427 domain-containing protein [Anaerolineales bacterium]